MTNCRLKETHNGGQCTIPSSKKEIKNIRSFSRQNNILYLEHKKYTLFKKKITTSAKKPLEIKCPALPHKSR